MSNKINTLLNFAIHEAKSSPMRCKHAAILFKGSKIISKGHNHHYPYYHGICCHAEMDCLKKMYHFKNIKWTHNSKTSHFNSYDLLVIRINTNDQLCDSKPCLHCLNILKLSLIPIRKIYYSSNNGTIICQKIQNISTTHISIGTRLNS